MNITCIQTIKSNDGTFIFSKKKNYDVHARVGQLIIIKDDLGCMHEIAREKEGKIVLGKQFKDVFSITVENVQELINI